MATFVPWVPESRARARTSRAGWVVAENDCHVWQGCKDECGYGVVRHRGNTRRVHRVRYEREVGQVPEGMELDHFACENRACCNPAHVRPVTHRENVLRGRSFAVENKAKTHCKNGHPLEGDNLIPYFAAVGQRQCNTCNTASSARYYARNRELVNARRRAERAVLRNG